MLTKRIAYLVQECAVSPRDILAITFTRKGSVEMKERLQRELAPGAAAAVTVGTFHAIAFRVLRRYAPTRSVPGAQCVCPRDKVHGF